MPAERHPSRERPPTAVFSRGRARGAATKGAPESPERLAWLTLDQRVDGRATLSHPRHGDHSFGRVRHAFRGKAGVGTGLHEGPMLPAQR